MKQPNILFIMSDDHATSALSCYGSRINKTPQLDRIANEGMRFDNCFCTNALCSPSRASILTGLYSHLNGVRTLSDQLDGRQQTVAKLLQEGGYQTAMIGKWHLGHGGAADPTGFDYWNVLPEQGDYMNPTLIEMGERKVHEGYVTDIITDLSLDWMNKRDTDKPFFLMCYHKAPHRSWIPDDKHADMYEDMDILEPETFHDDYSNRAAAASAARMRVDRDLLKKDLKLDPPEGLTPEQSKSWKYQRYIKDYLRCVASIDDNVGRMLDWLEEQDIADDTIIIYTTDHGFFLGEHGWFDKRFMYEESLRIPFIIRYPRGIQAGSVCEPMVLNVDFAPTFLEYAGLPVPANMQGASLQPLLQGTKPEGWRTSMYYRYWTHLGNHYVYAHYGVRTERYKLIYYYAEALDTKGSTDEPKPPEWELFDLHEDPYELNNIYDDPANAGIIRSLKEELHALRVQLQDDDGV